MVLMPRGRFWDKKERNRQERIERQIDNQADREIKEQTTNVIIKKEKEIESERDSGDLFSLIFTPITLVVITN